MKPGEVFRYLVVLCLASFLSAAASGQTYTVLHSPGTPTIDYRAGQTRANNAVAAPSASGGLTVQCDQASGTVEFILDIDGYFE